MFYFGLTRLLWKGRLVVVYQGNDAHDIPLWNWAERQLVKTLLATADCVVGVSRSLLDEVRRIFPRLRLTTSQVIPNGVPLDIIRQPRETLSVVDGMREYVLTVGQLIHRKGVDVLIDALAMAKARGFGAKLVIVGDGLERSTFVERSKAAGLSEDIVFVGDQSYERTLCFMEACLFFVLASRAEGLPLVILEALGCKKAVIATHVDGIPELVEHGRSGLLVDKENPRALADALVLLYRDEDLRQRLAQYGYEQVRQNYTWDAVGSRYLEIFHAV
jgi:glycosyltransferase involved in cell wall biosynthesis